MEDLFVSDNFRVLNKPPRVHYDEALTQSEKSLWEAAHRLDFETSGCLLVCRGEHLAAYRALFQTPEQGGAKAARKIYWAGASKALPSASLGEASGFIGGRYRSSKKVLFSANRTHMRGFHGVQPVRHVVKAASSEERTAAGGVFGGKLYRVELITGARHQIRAWFAAQGAPLQGDPVYGEEGARLELHARELSFRDPLSGRDIRVEAPLT